MAKEEIKYDGSEEEMFRLGLIKENGELNNKMRNEHNQYMARVWEKKNNSAETSKKYPSKAKTKQYFDNRTKKGRDNAKRRGLLSLLLGRYK